MNVRMLLLAALLLCACKGVGRSLVDSHPKQKGRSSTCGLIPSCSGLGIEAGATLGEQMPALVPVDPGVCPGGVSTSCTGNASPEAGDDCATVWNVDEEPAPDLSELSCAGLRITTNAYGGRQDVAVEEVHWSGVELAIESMRPIQVHLRRPVLEDVHIALSGPVKLDVDDLGYLHRVQISARASELLAPEVYLSESTIESLSVMSEGGPFPGKVTIEFGEHMDDSWLSAQNLRLDDVTMHNVVLSAQELHSDGAHFHEATLALDHGEMTSAQLYNSRVRSCALSLKLNDVSLHESELAACTGDRLYVLTSTVDRSSVAGVVESEQTTWTRSLIGAGGQLALTAYGSRFEQVNFCADTGLAGFGGEDNALSCSECEGKVPMCADAAADVQVDDANCPRLAKLKVCEQALPPPELSSE